MGKPMIQARRRIVDDEWLFDVTIAAVTETKDVHSGSATATTSWWIQSPVSTESLVDRLKTLLDSHASAAVFTVTWAKDTTGKITIASDGATFTITWTSTALRDWLGFTGTLSGANTYTGTHPCQGVVWCGSTGRSGFDNEWEVDTTDSSAIAESGEPAGVGSGQLRYDGEWLFRLEPPLLVTSPALASGTKDLAAAQQAWTFLDLWAHCRTFHGPIRYYDDRAGSISSYENGWDLKWVGPKKFTAPRFEKSIANTRYVVAMKVIRYLQAG